MTFRPVSVRLFATDSAHRATPLAVAVAVLAFLAFLSAALVIWAHGPHPPMDDFAAYWQAGEHVRTGGLLYGPVPDPPQPTVYRYAPWFAWIWAPFTVLPESVVRLAWYLILLAASVSVLLPMLRHGLAGWCAAGVFSVFFVDGAATGNVSPLMAAALFFALPTRFGPVAIAACASLKVFPLLLVLVYVGRRDWRSTALTLAVGAILVAPMLLYDLSQIKAEPLPTTYGLGTLPALWIGATLAGIAVTMRFAPSRYAWLVGLSASLVASPHLFLHYFALIAPGMKPPRSQT